MLQFLLFSWTGAVDRRVNSVIALNLTAIGWQRAQYFKVIAVLNKTVTSMNRLSSSEKKKKKQGLQWVKLLFFLYWTGSVEKNLSFLRLTWEFFRIFETFKCTNRYRNDFEPYFACVFLCLSTLMKPVKHWPLLIMFYNLSFMEKHAIPPKLTSAPPFKTLVNPWYPETPELQIQLNIMDFVCHVQDITPKDSLCTLKYFKAPYKLWSSTWNGLWRLTHSFFSGRHWQVILTNPCPNDNKM